MSDKDTYRPELAQVFVHGREYGFDIQYRSTREFVSWKSSYTTLKAHSITEAGEMVKLALSLAEKDLLALR